MYVDDCQLFLKFKVSDSANAFSAVNNDLILMSAWCSHNSLLINPGKKNKVISRWFIPQLTSQLPAMSITVPGKTISPVLGAKDLGVYLDQCLNYNIRITKSASTCFLHAVGTGK